jgi:hypothetical protein
MTRYLVIVLVALLAGTTAVALYEYWEVQDRDLRLVELNQSLAAANAARELAEKKALAAGEELAKAREDAGSRKLAADNEKKTTPAPAVEAATPGTAAPAKAAGPMEGFVKMFKTEEGKKMLRSQNETKTRMMFGSLVKGLNLSSADGDLVMSLLTDRSTKLSEAVFAATDASLNATNEERLTALSTAAEMVRSDYDQKLKATLGDAKFQQMKDEEGTVGDRFALSLTQSQSGPAPLNDDQRAAMLKIMSDTRKTLPPPVFDPTGQDVAQGLRALQDDTSEERHLSQESVYQQKVIQAAAGTLDPDQVNALQKGFERSLELQKFRIEMSKQMFLPPKAAK